MNQLCKVCGEPAAGYHFGAFTCEGCKSFFGRTYNNLAALGECKNNGQCVINKKNRTSCKSCRLKKCLMVGMSKSGSRYGRRSNWFKIHCLIQDQAEITNQITSRLAEHGVIGNNGQLQNAFNENKDLASQYKQEPFRETGSVSSMHHVSPNGASPSSSEGSAGGAIPSPYSSLFEPSVKPNGFAARLGNASPSFPDTRKDGNNHYGFHSSGLPLSPVSPLSPLNAASRFFFHTTAASALFSKGLNGVPKLYNGDLNLAAYHSRFLPIHALNPMLKSSKDTDTHSTGECVTGVPEQDRPIDLSVKPNISAFTATLKRHSKSCIQHPIGDHDSGFSLSSNEENNKNNTSPLDLTAKRTPTPQTVEDNEEPTESDDDEQHSQSQSNENK